MLPPEQLQQNTQEITKTNQNIQSTQSSTSQLLFQAEANPKKIYEGQTGIYKLKLFDPINLYNINIQPPKNYHFIFSKLNHDTLKQEKINEKNPNIEVGLPPLWCCGDNAAMIAKASAYLFKNKKYRNATKEYESINVDCLTKDEQIECKYKQGYCYYQTQEIEKASEIFKEVSKQKKDILRLINDSCILWVMYIICKNYKVYRVSIWRRT